MPFISRKIILRLVLALWLAVTFAALAGMYQLWQQWPQDLRYKGKGDVNALSYVTYLLIPRIPVQDAEHILRVKGATLTVPDGQLVPAPPADAPAAEEQATPKALLLAFAVPLGWAALLRKIWRGRTTWPEALACLFVTLLTLPTRFFFLSAKPAFGGAIVLALVGWATLLANALLGIIQKKNRAMQPAVSVSRGERIFVQALLLFLVLLMLILFKKEIQ
ncbi:MAG: hypothetical protein ACTFAL_08440 [Candidatus Electronema sp. V4]|uniref:hypothetical protein n=1 Tax=Candidatus Electronema sp. V4 TaxID=3454756 RepID=UPI00405540BC